MSVNGTKRTFQSRSAMSAFGGKADREHARYFATALGHCGGFGSGGVITPD